MERTEPKTLLSLFDGTGSICRPFVEAGWTVRRLDIDGGHGADIVVDIRKWDPVTEWQGPAPDVIVAGPPCENYSIARTNANIPRNLKLADSLVEKTIDIIEHFHTINPTMQYFVENPDSSLLWKRWVSHRLYEDIDNHPLSLFVKRLNDGEGKKTCQQVTQAKSKGFKMSCKDPRAVRLDYCQYGAKYRKRTRFMTNNPFRGRRCRQDCGSIIKGKHIEVAQRGPRSSLDTIDELHAYPDALTTRIFNHVDKAVPRERPGLGPLRPEPTLTQLRT
jgi:hypothetical protein